MIDRHFELGSVVKKSFNDSLSGTVISLERTFELSHVITGEKIGRISSNELFGNHSSEVRMEYAIFNDWVGELGIMEFDEYILLEDGSIVIPKMKSLLRRVDKVIDKKPSGLLSTRKGYVDPEPGDKVIVTKRELKLGKWIRGKYNPTVSSEGIFLKRVPKFFQVEWVKQNPDTEDFLSLPKPNMEWRADQLHLLRLIFIKNVIFRFGEKVYLKNPEQYGYSDNLLDINLDGSNMNGWVATSPQTIVTVVWQDGKKETLPAKNLVGFCSLDSQDYWPGDAVVLRPTSYSEYKGIIQTVNCEDRTAMVRFYSDPSLQEFSTEPVAVSLFELRNTEALNSFLIGSMVTIKSSATGAPINAADTFGCRFRNWIEEMRRHYADDARWYYNAIFASCIIHALQAGNHDLSLVDWIGMVEEMLPDGMVKVRCPLLLVGEQNYRIVPRDCLEQFDFRGVYPNGVNESMGYDYYESNSEGYDEDMQYDNEDNDFEYGEDDAMYENDYIGGGGGYFDPDDYGYDEDYQLSDFDDYENDDDEWEDIDESQSHDENITDKNLKNDFLDTKEMEFIKEHASNANLKYTIDGFSPKISVFATKSGDFQNETFHITTPSRCSPELAKVVIEHTRDFEHSFQKNVFVRNYKGNPNVFTILIIGPEETPFEYAPFMFIMILPDDFPKSPPKMFYSESIPNMKEVDLLPFVKNKTGEVCAPSLGYSTFARENGKTKWNPETRLSQVIVGVYNDIFCRHPLLSSIAEPLHGKYEQSDKFYSERAYILTRGKIRHLLDNLNKGSIFGESFGSFWVREFEAEIFAVYHKSQGGLLQHAIDDIKFLLDEDRDGNTRSYTPFLEKTTIGGRPLLVKAKDEIDVEGREDVILVAFAISKERK